MWSRRRFIRLGLIAGAAGAGGITLDHVLPLAPGRAGAALSARERAILRALGRRLLVGSARGFPDPSEIGTVGFIDRFLAGAERAVQDDVHTCIQAVEHMTPLSGIGIRPFTKLDEDDQERYLDWLETSSADTPRTIFAALKSLAAMGYYRHPRTWALIGYSGPVAPRGWDVYGGRRPSPRLSRASKGALETDVVVIGTGAGGMMMAAEIASAGKTVIALEEGEHLDHRDFSQREEEMVAALFQERGGRATEDLSVRIMQGRGVGGSTVHNTNLCKRAPAEILDQWESELRLDGLGARAMSADYAAVERELGVVPIPADQVNRNNAILRDGARALGWRTARLSHNRQGCIGSGFCNLGCPFDAKQNGLKVLLPRALAGGARVLPGAKAERILFRGSRATGVVATVLDARGSRRGMLEIRARAVCLAGSAIGSAEVALRSALPDPHGHVGRHLHIHPAVAVAGIFDDPVEGWTGIPQSIECTEHLDFTPGARDRTWLIPAFAHPIATATLTPGAGGEHAARMRDYARTAVVAAVLHDESEGSVRIEDGRLRIGYVLDAADRKALARGVRAA
ncbi:MAG: GMC family oxidoreductase N-terminal domain-containing protein, partial [Deltaproteobacteria bacterium]|nr:GMC family oxidoreductase N-terminal domain-containing protein [Deltaproteobacteria bacterium]